ncbi:MAG: ABC transporter permease subunit [Acidobacteria bacterium]|nr:ABC transporter permease subunit [Acidobacteriota bacterium]
MALAAVLFPKLLSYTRNLLLELECAQHVFAARARGLSEGRILMRYVMRPASSQLLALAGVSVSMALGASVPVEAFCDLPGIGQLAWKAALSRDLPVLVNLTVLVTAVTLTANTLGDTVAAVWGGAGE